MTGRFSGRGMMAFAGGTMAALLASRILPPIMAQAAGSARSSMGRDPFEGLIQDHRHFLDLLGQMEEAEDSGAFQRTQLLLRLKHALASHAMAEEDVVYPLLHDEAHSEDSARQLYAEHGEIKRHLYAMERLVSKDPAAWVDHAHALRLLIQDHARHEEEVDFPRLRQMLSEEELNRMAGHIQREKALLL
ncbi:hemerythrin domain-containing protein [Telmatospirillum sp. J64-1]|uniref:hemerythrin domain-containing protein n=1 Tax=Telmatospirillum sp. J64-1 TaxID=2502183 RepID=UPI00115D78C9|nr:hemerythrin domain-containing protein [Telmatospirillum sp. J64-1]